MNEQRIVEEQGIGFADLFWAILEQWRGMVATGLVFALLLAGAKYAMNVRRASKAGTESAVAEYGRHDDVYNTLRIFNTWQGTKELYETSPLMTIDPYNEERYVLRYFLSAEDPQKTDLYMIEGCYRVMMRDDDFAERMSCIFSDQIKEKYIQDLFLIILLNDAANAQQVGRGFYVMVVLPPNEKGYDYELIRSTVDKFVTDKRDKLKKTFGDFDVELISTNRELVVNESRRDAQIVTYTKLVTYEQQFEEAYNSIPDDRKRAVDKVVLEGNVKEWLIENRVEPNSVIGQTGGSASQNTAHPRFPKRTAALGFIAGIFIFAGLLFFRMVFSRRIRDGEEIRQVTGLRSFGSVYKYPYTSVWERFLHSKIIYEMRHKKAGRPEPEAGRIAKKASVKARHTGAPNVCMIVLGRSNEWVKDVVRRQEKIIEKDEIPCSVTYADQGASSIDESAYGGMGAALIVILSGSTSPEMAADLLTRLREYEIPVLGTEFLEGA